jgi:hypothetical protein
MNLFLICASAAIFASAPALAAEHACKERPDFLKTCWMMAGDIYITADNGTMLAADETDDLFKLIDVVNPGEMVQILRHDVRASIHGRFEVCRLSGADRFGYPNVCVESWQYWAVIPSWRDDDDWRGD